MEEVRIREKRIYTLMYADIMMMPAEREDEMRSMMGRLERYLDGKGLTLRIQR